MKLLQLQVFILFCFLKCRRSTQNIVFREGYDVDEKPPGRVQVNASLNLRNIISVSEKEQTISLEMTLRMFWKDERLSIVDSGDLLRDPTHYNLSYEVQTRKQLDNIWIPDLFVDEAKAVRNPTYKVPPESLRLYEDGSLRFSKRFNFDVACRMDFQKYPVDTQECIVHLESFTYSKEVLVFKWLRGEDTITNNPNISLAHYYYNMTTEEYDTKNKNTHNYQESFSGLAIKIKLTRKTRVYTVQDILPSFLYVWIAYFAVLMPSDVPGVRTALVLFPILNLTTLTNRIRTEIPAPSVLTYMDLWLACCLTFIFSSLVTIVSTAVLIRYKKEVWKKIEFWFKVLYPTIFVFLISVYGAALKNPLPTTNP